jgi:serine/threonine protein kinase
MVTMPNTTKSELFAGQKEKFKKEAKRMFSIKNSHVIGVHDLFEENGTAYYVMDFIDGLSLAEKMEKTGSAIAEKEVREILRQILDALQEVHQKDIWHLDLKPSNIMLDKSETAYLIDFGASKQIRANGSMTTSTALCYTPGYAPNEQVGQMYDRFGPWTDIYALGATVYNLLTNKKPPMGIDIEEDEEDAFDFPSTVSSEMQKLVMWMMQPKRKKRPQSVIDVLQSIEGRPKKGKSPIEIGPSSKEKTIVIGKDLRDSQRERIIQSLIKNMNQVEGGIMVLGATPEQQSNTNDDVQHFVQLKTFFIGKFQVTQEEWEAVMDKNPSKFKNPKHPVENVSWYECFEFILRLNKITGKQFRLPTEAEWEYAARGGKRSNNFRLAGSNIPQLVAWSSSNSDGQTHPVGTKQPNELGLYDMSGNVWEWCNDFYGKYDGNDVHDPQGPFKGVLKVRRGGCYSSDAGLRVSYRHYAKPGMKSDKIGFRLAL